MIIYDKVEYKDSSGNRHSVPWELLDGNDRFDHPAKVVSGTDSYGNEYKYTLCGSVCYISKGS